MVDSNYQWAKLIRFMVADKKWALIEKRLQEMLIEIEEKSDRTGISDDNPKNDFRFYKGQKALVRDILDWPSQADEVYAESGKNDPDTEDFVDLLRGDVEGKAAGR